MAHNTILTIIKHNNIIISYKLLYEKLYFDLLSVSNIIYIVLPRP